MADGYEPVKRAASLLEAAERCQEQGRFEDAEKLVAEARNLVEGNRQACAEIDLFRAMSLLKANKCEEGVRSLTTILAEYADWFRDPDSRDVYEMVQLQRAFSLVDLERSEEALPLLQEASSFRLVEMFKATFIVVLLSAISNARNIPSRKSISSALMRLESKINGDHHFTTTSAKRCMS